MKRIILLLYLAIPLLALPMFVQGQNNATTDKYIRIVGLSKKVIPNDGLKVQFTLSEIAGNEYKQIRPRPLSEVKAQFDKQVKSKGIDISKIVEDKLNNLTKSKYGKVESIIYYIIVKNEDEALKLSEVDVDGFKISSTTYVYDYDQDEYASEMALLAIKDAKRKAGSIAEAFGKSLGEILNIEDTKGMSSRSSSYAKSSKSKTKTITYKLNVTFDLQ